MIVTCPKCDAKYRVSAAALEQRGGRVRCASCAHVWTVEDDALPLTEQIEAPSFEPSPVEESIDDLLEDPQPAPQAEPEPAFEAEPTLKSKPHAAIRRREEERKLKTRLTIERAGWASIAACFVLVFASAYLMRGSVVEAWPRAAGAYAALGLDVNALGLVVEDLNASVIDDNGTPVLSVQGSVRNITGRERDVPALQAQVLNDAGDVLAQWSLSLAVNTLAEGESESFTTSISAPPESGTRIDVILSDDASSPFEDVSETAQPQTASDGRPSQITDLSGDVR